MFFWIVFSQFFIAKWFRKSLLFKSIVISITLKFQSSCFLGYHHVVWVGKNIVQANEVFIERLNREPFNFKLRKITLTCILILYSINCMFFFSLFCFVLFFFFRFILFFLQHMLVEKLKFQRNCSSGYQHVVCTCTNIMQKEINYRTKYGTF